MVYKNLYKFCEKIFKSPPLSENSVNLRFSNKQNVKDLFETIQNIFYYGMSNGNIENNTVTLTNITIEQFDKVSLYMKSFGIKPCLKIITHEEEEYIYMELKENIEKFNQENNSKIFVKIERSEFFNSKLSFTLKKLPINKIETILNTIIQNTTNLKYLKDFNTLKKTKLSDFFIRYIANNTMFVIFFDFYISPTTTFNDLLHKGQITK
ncbi:hypothetical protein OAI84_00295 [bacterium]|nr:hypothetical protein [bacterium]